MKYLVVTERLPTCFGAYVPDLLGCPAVGATREEVAKLIHEPIAFHIEGLRSDGCPFPCSTPELVEVDP